MKILPKCINILTLTRFRSSDLRIGCGVEGRWGVRVVDIHTGSGAISRG
jgi:hypothetical protein